MPGVNFPLATSGRPSILAYGVALLSVAAAIFGVQQMQSHWHTSAPVATLLLAVILTTRLGGPRPAVLAAVLSLAGFAYLIMPFGGSLAGEATQAVRLLALALVAGYLVWVTVTQLDALGSLRRAHDELRQQNEALRCENLERQRTEQALRASQQLLNLVLETLPVGVAVTDPAGDVILSNAASRRIWGDTIIRSGGERWVRSVGYWHESGKRIMPAQWPSVRALREGRITLNELIDIDAFDGKRRTIQASAAPIRDADGSTAGAVLVLDEVTTRVRAERTQQASAARLQELSRRLLAVQEEERRHLSRELHDEFGQLLAAVTLRLSAARSQTEGDVSANLEESITLLQRAAAQLRGLVLELRPAMLERAGLAVTLRWLADQHMQRSAVAIEVAGDPAEVPPHVAIVAFRVAQEALTNIVRHARAKHVWIELGERNGRLELEIRDDGAGFDVASVLEQASGRGQLGLLGMLERVEILDGDLAVDSTPGQGTRIRVSIPLAASAEIRRCANGD